MPSAGVLRIRSSRGRRVCCAAKASAPVLDEAAGIAEVGDVLARAAQAERVTLRDRLGRLASRVRASRRRSSSRSSRIAAAGTASPPGRPAAGLLPAVGLSPGAVQAEQDLALDHHVAGANPHARDLAIAVGTHLVLHLHRLDDRQHRAGAHAPAGLDGDRDDAAGEGERMSMTGSGFRG
jgi:hypothetical protein